MTWLLSFVFDNWIGKAAAAGAGLLALVVAFAWEQRTIGGERAVRKIEQAAKAADDVGQKAAARSRALSRAGVGAGGGRVQQRGEPLVYRD